MRWVEWRTESVLVRGRAESITYPIEHFESVPPCQDSPYAGGRAESEPTPKRVGSLAVRFRAAESVHAVLDSVGVQVPRRIRRALARFRRFGADPSAAVRIAWQGLRHYQRAGRPVPLATL